MMKKFKGFRKAMALVLAAALSLGAATTIYAEESEGVAIDKEAFDKLIASGITADDADIEANSWASAVKEAGVLRVGGTRTSFLFSQLDETDDGIRGFDAGLYQLLTRYILGDETKFELTQVDSSTRESVLESGQVDAVFATYSITDSRKEVISIAGLIVKYGNPAVCILAELILRCGIRISSRVACTCFDDLNIDGFAVGLPHDLI